MIFIIRVINFVFQLISLVVIVKVFLSYFMSPYHPIRLFIDRIIDPLLIPIRKYIPPIGMLDLSPIILLIIIQIIGRVVIGLLVSIS